MQRTESVKKALMLRGIHPNRILTQYHGIDYTAATEADARRVEISFLIVK
jgi:outer membrane protein OmpA-like peptidoglycan-associated protein